MPRRPLTRDRVLDAAMTLADAQGLSGLSMRKLARSVGVEAMSLYHHVANKEALLDALVERVYAEVALPSGPWMEGVATRCRSLRAALLRHPWAIGLMDTRRNPGPANLLQHEAMLRCFRQAGFSVPLTAQAIAVVDAFVYGFTLQEVSLPLNSAEEVEDVAGQVFAGVDPAQVPHLIELATQHVMQPGYAFGQEFEPGLALILEGLERRRQAGTPV